MSDNFHFCWVCAKIIDRSISYNIRCSGCRRSFHSNCVESLPGFHRTMLNRYKQFTQACPECNSKKDALDRWEKGHSFERVPRKSLNKLLLFTLENLLQDAPEPYNSWSANKFHNSHDKCDVQLMKRKCIQDGYDCPFSFHCDLKLIHHNYSIMMRNQNYFYRLGSTFLSELKRNYESMQNFKITVEKTIRYLEDCPHCILNFQNHNDAWLTMICPWGHPIILCEIDAQLWPAKQIKFNRSLGTVAVVLFGNGERARVQDTKCWLPCIGDLNSRPEKSKELAQAKSQAEKYYQECKRKFGHRFNLVKERRKLRSTDIDFIDKRPPSENEEIITLDDDGKQSGGSKGNKIGTIIEVCPIDEDEEDHQEGSSSDKDNTSDANNNNSTNLVSSTCDQSTNSTAETSRCEDENSRDQTMPRIPVSVPLLTPETIQDENPKNDMETVTSHDKPIDAQLDETPDDKVQQGEATLSPEFIVEYDVNAENEHPSLKLQPISHAFAASKDDSETLFEATSTLDNPSIFTRLRSPTSSSFSIIEMNGPTNKKIKFDIDQSTEVRKLKERLESAEKQKELNLRQIEEAQRRANLAMAIADSQIKMNNLKNESQINGLEEALRREKEDKELMVAKLEKEIEQNRLEWTEKTNELESRWKNKLEEAIEIKEQQHSKELIAKNQEIEYLKVKIKQSEDLFIKLQQKYNQIVKEFSQFRAGLVSLTAKMPTMDEDGDVQPEKINNDQS